VQQSGAIGATQVHLLCTLWHGGFYAVACPALPRQSTRAHLRLISGVPWASWPSGLLAFAHSNTALYTLLWLWLLRMCFSSLFNLQSSNSSLRTRSIGLSGCLLCLDTLYSIHKRQL
jgi:hypothetical protein